MTGHASSTCRVSAGLVAVLCAFALAGCSSSPSSSSTSPQTGVASRQVDLEHFSLALRLSNEATTLLNRLGDQAGGKVMVGNMEGFRQIANRLEAALREARLVSDELLSAGDAELPRMWRREFIAGLEGKYDYYSSYLVNPNRPPATSAIMEAVQHSDRWGDWFDSRRESVIQSIGRKGYR